MYDPIIPNHCVCEYSYEIKEAKMQDWVRICDLKHKDRRGRLVELDLSRPDERDNDTDPDFASDPPSFRIMTISELQSWSSAEGGRKPPQGSHNSGNATPHKHRSIHHPDDPVGLVAVRAELCAFSESYVSLLH